MKNGLDVRSRGRTVLQIKGYDILNGAHPIRLVLRRSDIHGKGVFAKVDLKKGDCVEYHKLAFGTKGFGGFNHSCEPNVRLTEGWSIAFLVSCPIASGTELTVSYTHGGPPKCNCPVCRREA